MSEQRPDSDMEEDKTLIRQEPNDDETNVRPDNSASSGPRQTSNDPGATDETIIRSADESAPAPAKDGATILREPTSGEPVASENDSTIIRQPASNERATILRGSAKEGTSTILRGATTGDSATILREPETGKGAHEDATVIRDGAAGDDATIISSPGEDDSTVMGGGRSGADTTYVASGGKPTQSRGNSEAGRLLKNRFVLEERVGSGGMGDVYKALDLRQQEAQERNPYIAIKILNESFARHKDAFISLQREATRTRGIPHPNIMAVYDFDREGETVFMSMELLDGKPLDDYLKEHPEGVSVDDAWNIIDGICQGLSRAHGAGIVHSDFKPGNIYYTADKLAKVFDFGIARAVSSPGDLRADGEKTVFDAGSLGALTPTYASYEMLTGQEPTKSDDVYAVALVAYELFTGRHPYNRTPADKALERGLEPEPVSFLKRRHWRALKKGLALKGEDRYQTIDEFYEGMFSEDPPYFRYGAIGAVLIISLSVGAYSFFHKTTVPLEETQIQGVFDANTGNLAQRLNDPKNWNFKSEDWRNEVRLSLGRIREADIQLYEKWQVPHHPGVEHWKEKVLDSYLTEIADIREKVAKINVAGNLQDQLTQVKGALDQLQQAELYLGIVKKYYNFNSARIADEGSRLAQALQFRQFQDNSIENNIKQADERAAAEKAAEEQRVAAQKAREQRDATYKQDLATFSNILRCKGDISPPDVLKLGEIIDGPTGLKKTYPSQFAIDKPGIVAALRGCIEERIGVRDPRRARVVKAKVMAYLPGEPALESIKIQDLDPCAARSLEGNGIRNGNWCSDRLAVGGTGPEMVVVPKGPGIAQKFAISRIEIKVSDYNQFCEATGCKKVPGPGTLPVTDISLKQAEAYARWLSDETGHHYRLPTPTEWEYAARTNVDEPIDENVNCTVDSRGVRLGEKLQSALSGRPNHWGLYNFVGNAREWAVTKGGKVFAMGGAHTTPRAECTIDRKIPNSGKPDAITGFRLFREIQVQGG